jgi:hypothetical protein
VAASFFLFSEGLPPEESLRKSQVLPPEESSRKKEEILKIASASMMNPKLSKRFFLFASAPMFMIRFCPPALAISFLLFLFPLPSPLSLFLFSSFWRVGG